MKATRIIVIAKAPLQGFAKTRLAPALGAEGAARLAERLLDHTVTMAMDVALGPVELCVAPDPDDLRWGPWRTRWPQTEWTAQGEGDLGGRMARAAQRSLAMGQPVLLIGTDCPALDPERLACAAAALDDHDLVINPASDGGYVLMGLARYVAEVFADMPWSTSTVAAETLRRAHRLGLRVCQLETLDDIDEPPDLAHLPPSFLPAEL